MKHALPSGWPCRPESLLVETCELQWALSPAPGKGRVTDHRLGQAFQGDEETCSVFVTCKAQTQTMGLETSVKGQWPLLAVPAV